MAETATIDQSSVHTGVGEALPIVTGSITSRVLVNNRLLRVVQFTLDAGEQLTEHSSPRAVVVHLIEGTMTFVVNGDESMLRPGDVVYLAPGAPHALTAVTGCRMSLVMIDIDNEDAA